MNGKNPTNAPASAAISIIDIIEDPFSTNIINNETADITEIPDDSPSNPSIRFIAFVTIIIHAIVNIIDVIWCISGKLRNGNVIPSILIPAITAAIAASSCPNSLTIGFIDFISSTTQNAVIIPIPTKNPSSFFPYCSKSNKFIVCSILITISKYIVETKNPKITAGPPNLGMDFLCILLSSFGISTAPTFRAIFIVYGVVTNATTNARTNAIAISPHITYSSNYFIFSFSISSIICSLS